MSPKEATQVANTLSLRCRQYWSSERLALFTTDMLASPIGVLPYEVVANTLRRLASEVDPDAITLAKLIEAVKTRPVLPPRTMLPPAYDSSGPAEKRIYWPERPNGKEQFPIAEPDEAERERMRFVYARGIGARSLLRSRPDLGLKEHHFAEAERRREIDDRADIPPPRLGNRANRALMAEVLVRIGLGMKFKCANCGREMSEVDIHAYTHRCMDAGARGGDAPTRLCIACLPEPEVSDDVPF